MTRERDGWSVYHIHGVAKLVLLVALIGEFILHGLHETSNDYKGEGDVYNRPKYYKQQAETKPKHHY